MDSTEVKESKVNSDNEVEESLDKTKAEREKNNSKSSDGNKITADEMIKQFEKQLADSNNSSEAMISYPKGNK